jgi:hypothetical protein
MAPRLLVSAWGYAFRERSQGARKQFPRLARKYVGPMTALPVVDGQK